MKRRIYEILEQSRPDDLASRVFNLILGALIVLNVVAIVVASVQAVGAAYRTAFRVFEVASVLVFAVEYLTRLWCCTESERYREPVKGRLRFAATPFMLIDLVVIAPFFLTVFGADLRVLRAIRLFRFFRILKLARYSRAMRTLGRVLVQCKEELTVSACAMGVLLLLASSLMYFVENQAQPDAFSSIPASMWWGVSTLTTVGYGDIFPVTALGKIIGAVIAVLGIGMFALPAGILAAAFAEELSADAASRPRRCPHCGERI